ncbi:hypothetical protein HPB47_000808, partial [Ixodes persulcatus]
MLCRWQYCLHSLAHSKLYHRALLLKVSLEHVQKLVSIDSQHNLKLAPNIKEKQLNSSYFDKMDVGSAYALLNHAVGAAIKYLVQEGMMGEETLTTAWFLELVFKWFSLMTSRTIKLAMSQLNPTKHEEAVTFLENVVYIFSRLSFYKQGQRECFKPCQAGMIVTTKSVLKLQQLYRQEKEFKFLFMSRTTQDCLENIFSLIFQKNPVPPALNFKMSLRIITLSQFFASCWSGSYDEYPAEHLLSYMKAKPPQQKSAIDEDFELPDCFLKSIPEDEKASLHYVAGYAARN